MTAISMVQSKNFSETRFEDSDFMSRTSSYVVKVARTREMVKREASALGGIIISLNAFSILAIERDAIQVTRTRGAFRFKSAFGFRCHGIKHTFPSPTLICWTFICSWTHGAFCQLCWTNRICSISRWDAFFMLAIQTNTIERTRACWTIFSESTFKFWLLRIEHTFSSPTLICHTWAWASAIRALWKLRMTCRSCCIARWNTFSMNAIEADTIFGGRTLGAVFSETTLDFRSFGVKNALGSPAFVCYTQRRDFAWKTLGD